MIDNDNGQLYSQLSAYVQQYTTTSEAEFNHMWTEAQNALQAYNTDNLSTIDLLNVMQNHIYDLTGQIEIYQTQIDNVSDAIDSVSSSINTIKDNINNNANAITNNAQAVMDYTDKANKLKEALGEAVEMVRNFVNYMTLLSVRFSKEIITTLNHFYTDLLLVLWLVNTQVVQNQPKVACLLLMKRALVQNLSLHLLAMADIQSYHKATLCLAKR